MHLYSTGGRLAQIVMILKEIYAKMLTNSLLLLYFHEFPEYLTKQGQLNVLCFSAPSSAAMKFDSRKIAQVSKTPVVNVLSGAASEESKRKSLFLDSEII